MRRFGRSSTSTAARRSCRSSPFFFDLLYLDGEAARRRAATRERVALLERLVAPGGRSCPRLVTRDAGGGEALLRARRCRAATRA